MIVRLCRHCHRAIVHTSGGWYHVHSASSSCRPGAGPGPVAEPQDEQ